MTETHDLHSWPQPYRLPDAEPFRAALTEDRLTYQRCGGCAEAVWPAHSYCPHCNSDTLTWEESAGQGSVYSHSTIHRGPTPVWASIAPYTVGFVRLDEGYHLFTQFEGDPDAIEIGARVSVRFIDRGEQRLPVFSIAKDDTER